jgi:phosphoribosyl-AMP cyclohydrolase
MKVLRPDFDKRGGLVTVVAQSMHTKEVLMLAYADEAALRRTLETGLATYYSTSRKRLWTKGEESGNFQKVVDVLVDCDGDALVYLVEPQGDSLACHTGARSCFFRSVLGYPTGIAAPKSGIAENLDNMETEVLPTLIGKPARGGS